VRALTPVFPSLASLASPSPQHMLTRSAEERNGGAHRGNIHSDPSVQRGMQLLAKCAAYCVNEVECRRVLLLRYFGEEFSKEACRGTCDNCRRTQNLTMLDVTDHAYAALQIVKAAGSTSDTGSGSNSRYNSNAPKPLTIVQLATRYSTKEKTDKHGVSTTDKGTKLDDATLRALALRPSLMTRDTAERLMQVLVLEGFLQEDSVLNQSGFSR